MHIYGGGWNGGKRLDKVLLPMLPKLLAHEISVVSLEFRSQFRRLKRHHIAKSSATTQSAIGQKDLPHYARDIAINKARLIQRINQHA